jgi:hypothetical protein
MTSTETKKYTYGRLIDNSFSSMCVTQVLARAGRQCQKCRTPETGERGSYVLHIHRKDGDDENNSFNNLALVCAQCDDALHRGLVIEKPPITTPSLLAGIREMERSTRQAEKIERVTDELIRSRIEKITPKSVMMCVKYLYVVDGRVSEGVSIACPSDKRTTPRGPVGTDAKVELWFPSQFATEEEAFMAQRDDGVKRVFPAVVFTVSTAKKRGRIRTCAVPLDPKMEPWAMELMRYFEEHGNSPVFPLTRQRVWAQSKKVWRDLVYVIEDYSVVIDKKGLGIERIDSESTEKKREIKRIDRHPRDWSLRALRHLRASDLVDHYGFTGANLSSFGGWTISAAMSASSSVVRYFDLDWRGCFVKLLKKRY